MEIEIGATIVAILFIWLGSVEIRIRSKASMDFCNERSKILDLINTRLLRIESKLMGG